MRKVVLTLKENEKYQVIKKLVETNGNKQRAAIKLGLTVRHINRLILAYHQQGKASFVHGNRGRKPVSAFSSDFKNHIENLYTSKYFDCTYTLFAELLGERENITVSVDEVRNILKERYILSPKSHKATKRKMKQQLLAQKKIASSKKELSSLQQSIVAIEDAHPRQPRCIYFGEEIQMDASIHLWFGSSPCALHAAIDDATGSVVAAFFDKQESLFGYYNIAHQILSRYGIPYLFKADRRTVFEYKKKGTTFDEDNTFTQFSYACSQLGISIQTSSSPEFKARIERLFGTFQHRLTVALRLANISSIDEANAFLPAFLDKYNSRFALCIHHTKSVFEKQPDEQQLNLILSTLSRRVVDSGHAICFRKKYYRLVNSSGIPIYFGKGTKCMVIESFDKRLYATVEDSIFSLEEIPKTQAISVNFDEVLPVSSKKIFIPKMIHPFKRKSFEKFMEKQALQSHKVFEKDVS